MPGDSSQFNLVDCFLGEDRLRQFGNHTAIEFRDNRVTYGELHAEVSRWARQLLDCVVNEGDRVALLLYDSPEFCCVLSCDRFNRGGLRSDQYLPASG